MHITENQKSTVDITIVQPAQTDEQAEIMDTIITTIRQVEHDGYGTCKLCRVRFYGEFGDVLEQLGEHGEAVHDM